jgi:hypothetical protein
MRPRGIGGFCARERNWGLLLFTGSEEAFPETLGDSQNAGLVGFDCSSAVGILGWRVEGSNKLQM